MITETFAAKVALYVSAGALGYLALDRFCDNAGIQEPLSAVAKSAIVFSKNLKSEFSGVDSEKRALAEMAARRAYAMALAENMPEGTPCAAGSPVTK